MVWDFADSRTAVFLRMGLEMSESHERGITDPLREISQWREFSSPTKRHIIKLNLLFWHLSVPNLKPVLFKQLRYALRYRKYRSPKLVALKLTDVFALEPVCLCDQLVKEETGLPRRVFASKKKGSRSKLQRLDVCIRR